MTSIKTEMTTAIRSGLLTFAVLCAAAPAQALVLNQVDGNFFAPVGGSNVSIQNGSPTGGKISWGVPASSAGKSGLAFEGFAPGSVVPLTDFLLGTLTHNNRPINSGTAASAVSLSVLLDSLGTSPSPLSFTFDLLIDETPNRTPCAYPSAKGNPCADKITIADPDQQMSFAYDGGTWTLDMFFQDALGNPTDDFISQEKGSNAAHLYGRFVAPNPPQNPSEVPGPLPALGLAATFGWSRKLRRRMRVDSHEAQS
jgi:hypothetical protein